MSDAAPAAGPADGLPLPWSPSDLNQTLALLYALSFRAPTDCVLREKLFAFEDGLWSESVEKEWETAFDPALHTRLFVRLYLDNTYEASSHAGLLSVDGPSRTYHVFNPRGRHHQLRVYAVQHEYIKDWLRNRTAHHWGAGASRQFREVRDAAAHPVLQQESGQCALCSAWWLREQLGRGRGIVPPGDDGSLAWWPPAPAAPTLTDFYVGMMRFRHRILLPLLDFDRRKVDAFNRQSLRGGDASGADDEDRATDEQRSRIAAELQARWDHTGAAPAATSVPYLTEQGR